MGREETDARLAGQTTAINAGDQGVTSVTDHPRMPHELCWYVSLLMVMGQAKREALANDTFAENRLVK